MEMKFPESSIVNPPHKIEGDMRTARDDFFEFAKSRVRYMTADEFADWVKEMVDNADIKIGAGFVPFYITFKENSDGSEERFIENLEIGINRDEFTVDGESFEDLIPFVLEHEIQEAWLNSKRGHLDGPSAATQEGMHTKHLLAERKEFYLAEKAGLGEKLFRWRMRKYPEGEEEYLGAWESAKKRFQLRPIGTAKYVSQKD